jgi:cellulose synthase/poly-beta-1,6-N-acetylglucosamine synthase-like glycosyltransferase
MTLLRLETSGREERQSRGEKHIVVIPAYNEERSIIAVIRGLKQQGFARLIVVDDGSSDRTSELARQEGVILLQHILNRGLGGALGTGISAALRLGAEIIVTFDADGQHDPNDIGRLLEPIENGEADVVLAAGCWIRWACPTTAAWRTGLPVSSPISSSESGRRIRNQVCGPFHAKRRLVCSF